MRFSRSGAEDHDEQPSRATGEAANLRFDDQVSAGELADASAGAAGAAPWSPTMPIETVSSAGARLRVEEGSVEHAEIRLDAPSVSIGRRAGNDVVIHDTNVSRQHARILSQGDGYVIEDTNSANGTRVNGRPIADLRELRDGDRIEIGDARFAFELRSQSDHPEDVSIPPNEPAEPRYQNAVGDVIVATSDPAPLSSPEGLREWSRPAQAATAALESVSFAEDPVPFPDDQPADARAVAEPIRALDADDSTVGGRMDDARHELGELRREVAESGARLDRVLERAGGLETSIGKAAADLDRFDRVMRGPGHAAFVESVTLLEQAAVEGGGDELHALRELLDQLVEHPRDIDLLRQVSDYAKLLREAVERQARLAVVAPALRAALGDILA